MNVVGNYSRFAVPTSRMSDMSGAGKPEAGGQNSPVSANSTTPMGTASYRQAVMSLTTSLNMADQTSGGMQNLLVSPFLALSLTAPSGSPKQSATVSAAPSFASDTDIVTEPTADNLAKQIIDKLGADGALTLQQAEDALVTSTPGHQTNSAATVEKLFGRADANHDGKLRQAELTTLLGYYRNNSTPSGTAPKLPNVWG